MSLFAQHTAGGAFIKPADLNGQLIIIANVAAQWSTEYDTLRKADVEIATFDYATVGGDWQRGVRCNYNGINNKLGNIRGNNGLILGRIGTAKTTGGYDAWVLAAYTAEDEQAAGAWLAANPAPSLFAPQSAPATPPAAAPAAAPVAAAQAQPVPAPAPAGTATQLSPEAIAQMMAALQAQPQ